MTRRGLAAALAALAMAAAPGCAGPVPPRAAAGVGRDACPYLPAFVALRDRVAAMTPAAALPMLYAYLADPANENPAACESFAVDAMIDARERSLATLRLADGRVVAAHLSFRCVDLEPRTAGCAGAVADDTAHPYTAGVEPIALDRATVATIESALPGATLEGVYRIRVADLFDDGPGATRLPDGAAVTLAPGEALTAVAAVFSAPAPWRRRKLVWYYR